MQNGQDDPEDDDDMDWIESVRAKWSMDGATTLSEAAAKLRKHAAWLEELERDGSQLMRLSVPVDLSLND